MDYRTNYHLLLRKSIGPLLGWDGYSTPIAAGSGRDV